MPDIAETIIKTLLPDDEDDCRDQTRGVKSELVITLATVVCSGPRDWTALDGIHAFEAEMARIELLEEALTVARRYRERHRGYESKEKACRALKRRSKGFTVEEYRAAFERALALWFAMERAVAELVGPNPEGIAGIGQGSGIEAGLCEQFPEFPTSAISNSIGYLGFYLTR